MLPDPDLRTGVIIIRLWQGSELPAGLRARLTVKLDVEAGEELSGAASSVEGLLAEVRRWAEAFLAAEDPP